MPAQQQGHGGDDAGRHEGEGRRDVGGHAQYVDQAGVVGAVPPQVFAQRDVQPFDRGPVAEHDRHQREKRGQ
ncbi:hypothetical protein [Phytohabitans kaempferiae]|uniref:Uncharacterized protein n=1 Tax=Phytohabitans kaempferiae TaxID=1620943 RepID=A0ABV6MFH7_9ACTN